MDAYELRVEWIPFEWKRPTVEVLDTLESVTTKLRVLELDPNPDLVLGLTELILQRKDSEKED